MNKYDLDGRQCSCHVNPPCSYCIDRSIVETIENCDNICSECNVYEDCEKDERWFDMISKHDAVLKAHFDDTNNS